MREENLIYMKKQEEVAGSETGIKNTEIKCDPDQVKKSSEESSKSLMRFKMKMRKRMKISDTSVRRD